MLCEGMKRRAPKRGEDEFKGCSNHPYGAEGQATVESARGCTICQVYCSCCDCWKRAAAFNAARMGPSVSIGLWRSRCKACEHAKGRGEAVQ